MEDWRNEKSLAEGNNTESFTLHRVFSVFKKIPKDQ